MLDASPSQDSREKMPDSESQVNQRWGFAPIAAVLLLADAVQVPLAAQVQAVGVGDWWGVGQRLLRWEWRDSFQARFDAVPAENLELAAGGEDDGCALIVQHDDPLADQRGARGDGDCVVVHQ